MRGGIQRLSVMVGFLLAACQSPATSPRQAFDKYIDSAVVVPYTKFGVAIARAPSISIVAISPNGRLLAFTTHNPNKPSEDGLKIISLESGDAIAAIPSLSLHFGGLSLAPGDALFDPQSEELYVEMDFSDNNGGEWLEYDLTQKQFLADGQKDLALIGEMTLDKRESTVRDSVNNPFQP